MRLKDIAALAKVSPSTISLVMNGKDGVSAEKRSEIIKLLKDYGYTLHAPSAGAVQTEMASKNIRFIKLKRHAMLVDGNPGFTNAIVDAVELECRRKGYTLLMTTCAGERLKDVLDSVQSESLSGILLFGTELTDADVPFLTSVSLPIVILDNSLRLSDINCITMNNEAAIHHAVSHLASIGHTHIGFLANRLPSNNCMERREAFPAALQRHGLRFEASLVYEVHPTPEGAYQSVCTLLERGEKFPSALVANNDSIAFGAIKAFRQYGIRVPEDISITGLDNIPLSSITDPPLTTMEVPCTEMGIWAVRLLIDCINYPDSSTRKMQLSTHLIVRGSTAPPVALRE